jgi:hypothetical protein
MWNLLMKTFFITIQVLLLASCETNNDGQNKYFHFKNENEFKKALTGTWILKKYRDSVRIGKTPIQIENLLTGVIGVYYDPDKKYSYNFPEDFGYEIFISSQRNGIETLYSIKFDLKNNSIDLIYKNTTENYDTTTRKWIKKIEDPITIGKMYFTLSDNEKILNVHFKNDTLSTELVKSDDYDILLNKKYIAGEYLVLKGSKKLGHIYFKENGNVIGLENLDESMRDLTLYQVSLSYLSEGTDMICFKAHDWKVAIAFSWRKEGDTLVIINNASIPNIEYRLIPK